MSVVCGGRKHSRAGWTGLRVGAVVLSATWVLCLAGVARAGEYHVYSCRTPTGAAAPTEGWSGSVSGVYDSDPNGCETGGGLVAALNADVSRQANADKAQWLFTAPAGETVAGATLWLAGQTAGGNNANASYLFWLAGRSPTNSGSVVFDECAAIRGCVGTGTFGDSLAAENRVEVPSAAVDSPYLSLNVTCGSAIEGFQCPTGPPTGYAAEVELFAADIVLDQPQGPSVQDVGGALAGATTVSGTTDVAFQASDPGAGIYEALFTVDGRTAASTPLDEQGGHCRAVGQAADGLPAFLYVRPCAPSVSVDVPFDTTGLSNGSHHLVVSVTDAAGNSAVVLEREITVANPAGNAQQGATGVAPPAAAGAAPSAAGQATGPQAGGRGAPGTEGPANGLGASAQAVLSARWRGSTAERTKVSFGDSPRIEGRLAGAGGEGITGAVIQVIETPQQLGARAIALANVRTGTNGTWSMSLPRTPRRARCGSPIGRKSEICCPWQRGA